MWRRWLATFGAVAFMVAALAAEWWWLPPEGYPQRYGYIGDQYQSVGSLFIQLVIASWHWFQSSFDHDAITTIAIAATAIFTGTLWRATDRLWRISQIHAGHMEGSIAVAEKSAGAAVIAANAAKAAADQAEIARKTFLLMHRPRIRVIHISLGHLNRREPVFQLGQPMRARVGIRNIGETDAKLSMFTYRIFVAENGQPDRWPMNPKMTTSFRRYQQTIGRGLGTIIEMEDEPVNDPVIGFGGNWEVYVFGRITYFNDLNIARSTAFCRKCVLPRGRRSPRMVRVDDAEFEYEE